MSSNIFAPMDGISAYNADDDEELEDLGFFSATLNKTTPDDAAQQALNELGLVPSPPRRRLQEEAHFEDDEDDDNMPFDLERELELEELQMQEEQSQPTPYDNMNEEPEEADEFTLESNGVLEEADSSPIATPPPPLRSAPSVLPGLNKQSEASSSRLPEPRTSEQHAHSSRSTEEQIDDEAEEIGINGLPKYIPAGVTHISLLDGTSIRVERRRRVMAWAPKPAHYGVGPTGLLSRPVHQIVDRVEAMAAEQIVRKSEALIARATASCPQQKTEMWQERYRPTRFTELVGEERTHREVLTWIKSWDKCVFGKKSSSSKKRFRIEDSNATAAPSGGGYGAPEVYKDKFDRPKERILLLGGPAGMGKTTLAHVAAKASGYLVHEINASDDRSAKTVEDRVRDALESNSLSAGKSRQPTCLVLDEVDGATGGGNADGGGGGFIRALIKLVEQGSSSGKSKRNGKSKRSLLRPIICICNDPYAPSLRALRPYSKLVRLNRPSTPALMARMRQICERESIRHDTAGLSMLVTLCQGDVRSCLNALQLIRNDERGVTVAALQGGRVTDGATGGTTMASALSIKDGNSSIHQVWNQLFRTQTSRERDRQRGAKTRALNDAAAGGANVDGLGSSEAQEVVSSVISAGEMDKIMAGCFEHYPNLKLVDDGWQRFRKVHDWLHWYEYLNQRGWELGIHTEIWGYLPWSFVCWRMLFANTANELPVYPHVDYQNYLKRTAFDEMAADVQSNLPAHTRSQFDKTALVTELGPMLFPLLTPDVKPINMQLVKPEEKAAMASCVSILHNFNIDFVLDKNEQGHSYFRFEPPLEAFAHYEGKRVEGQAGTAGRFNVRQMMTTELHSFRVRQRQGAISGTSSGAARRGARGEDEVQPKQTGGTRKAIGAVDFFGRPVLPKSDAADTNALPEAILARRREKENQAPGQQHTLDDDDPPPAKRGKIKVFYHFNEGYSNAVRKPIKMSALLS